MPTVHLICGSTGAGKTTYAIAVAQRTKGVRFTIDDWVNDLFVIDRPVPGNLAWAAERIARCERRIWAVTEDLVSRDIDVVLDLGLSRREHRDRIRERVAQTRAESKLHYLDVAVETRRERILKRNRAEPKTHVFELTESMFDAMEPLFEPPSDDELYTAMILCE